MRAALKIILVILCVVCSVPDDPRYAVDARCGSALTFDAPGMLRNPATRRSKTYANVTLAMNATSRDCGAACCGDFVCQSFVFVPTNSAGPYADRCPTPPRQGPCCLFVNTIDPTVAVAVNETDGVVTGHRATLSPVAPPYPASRVLSAVIHPEQIDGIDGDEFPITWADDDAQYTGAGDNRQPGRPNYPASFFKVVGDAPGLLGTASDRELPVFSAVGPDLPIQGSAVDAACPRLVWNTSMANVKSSSVLSLKGVLYWAVACFNYGDDPHFNRQRYGPAWIATSHDKGASWNVTATPTDMFQGRLAAPRFAQFGKDHADALDGYVYVYFPCAYEAAAFFCCNDLVLLGRVPADDILVRARYEFYAGARADGSIAWCLDDALARPVFEYALRTSVQQVNYLASRDLYVFANWAWLSLDGNPKPDHTTPRTERQRTQLSLFAGPNPWGPWSTLLVDDDWRGADGSAGGYTPVLPPKWMSRDEFWLVATQCCGQPQFGARNHYNFSMQRVLLHDHGRSGGGELSKAEQGDRPLHDRVVAQDERASTADALADDFFKKESDPKTPNMLVVVVDDVGYNGVGYVGAHLQQPNGFLTPRIDALAKGAVKLSAFYALPLCAPTRAALLTARYPFRLGLSAYNADWGKPWSLGAEHTLVAARLQTLGYATALFGKWHLGTHTNSSLPTSRGFDVFEGFLSGGLTHYSHDTGVGVYPASAFFPEGCDHCVTGFDYHRAVKGGGLEAALDLNGTYSAYAVRDATVRFLREKKKKKKKTQHWFVLAAFQQVHPPDEVDEVYVERYAVDYPDATRDELVYAGMISCADDAVGAIADALGADLDSTLIVFLSDNGAPAERRTPTGLRAAHFKGGKTLITEGGVRVPCFLRYPPLLRPRWHHGLFHVVDLAPTLLALARGRVHDDARSSADDQDDGLNAWPALIGGFQGSRNEILYNINPRADDADQLRAPKAGIRAGAWKLTYAYYVVDWTTRAVNTTGPALFNLNADPMETTDVHAQNAATARDLRSRLDAHAARLVQPYQPWPPFQGDDYACCDCDESWAAANGEWLPWIVDDHYHVGPCTLPYAACQVPPCYNH